MALLVVLGIAEIAWLAVAGFPELTRVVPLPGGWEWDVHLRSSATGSILAIGLGIAVWRELRPAYYVALVLETLITVLLAAVLLSGGLGPFSAALVFTAARLAILLSPPVRLTLMRGRTLRTAIAR